MTRSALYRGSLYHARRDAHARRAFRYPVYVACLDLDELPALDRDLRLFSYGRPNLFSLDGGAYSLDLAEPGVPSPTIAQLRGAAAAAGPLRARHARVLAAHGLPAPASARLVTNLAVLGYAFNPVSFFLGYDTAGALTSVVAEVNNTYGGRRVYVLGPEHRIATSAAPGAPDAPAAARAARAARAEGDATPAPARARRAGFRHARDFFVSPFLHGPCDYEFWFEAPLDGDSLAIWMHVDTPAGDRVFLARLEGERRALSDRALAAAALRYPLMTAQVIGLIHYEALKLHLSGVPYHRPGIDHRPIGWDGSLVSSAHRSASMK